MHNHGRNRHAALCRRKESIVTVVVRELNVWEGDPRPAHLFSRRLHLRLSYDHFIAVLVDALAVQQNDVTVGALFRHRH